LRIGDNEGRLPVHHVVRRGFLDLVDVLVSLWPNGLLARAAFRCTTLLDFRRTMLLAVHGTVGSLSS
jgi:hypothetical protein